MSDMNFTFSISFYCSSLFSSCKEEEKKSANSFPILSFSSLLPFYILSCHPSTQFVLTECNWRFQTKANDAELQGGSDDWSERFTQILWIFMSSRVLRSENSTRKDMSNSTILWTLFSFLYSSVCSWITSKDSSTKKLNVSSFISFSIHIFSSRWQTQTEKVLRQRHKANGGEGCCWEAIEFNSNNIFPAAYTLHCALPPTTFSLSRRWTSHPSNKNVLEKISGLMAHANAANVVFFVGSLWAAAVDVQLIFTFNEMNENDDEI